MSIPLNPLRLSDIPLTKKGPVFSGAPWKSRENDRVILFSRGQWALKMLGSAIITSRNRVKGMILIPEYFCEISLTPMRTPEFDIRFYRITPGLEPDIADLERVAGLYGPPDMMLFVHYFGLPLSMGAAEVWCRKNGVVLIEDAAHSLLPVPGIGDHGCPVIYTPWKFMNLPDGALLVLPEKSEVSVEMNENDEPYPWLWLQKRVASTVATGLHLPVHKFRKIHVKTCDESEPPIDPGKPGCGRRSAAILAKKEKDLPEIGRIREHHYRRIDDAIANSDAQTHRIFRHLPGCFAPYVYPLRIAGDTCWEIMDALNNIGIPAQPWSDLSPEVKNSAAYPVSNSLRKEVMALPVHQDLKPSQIDWMTREVIRLVSKNGRPGRLS